MRVVSPIYSSGKVKKNQSKTQLMRAAVIAEPGRIIIEQVDLPQPKPDQVRVKIEGCGICASNIPVWQGKPWFSYPMPAGAPGHEAWGTIDALGSKVEHFNIGDRVCMLSGNAYAQYDTANQDSIVKLPEFLDGKPFCGEPLGCAVNVFERSEIQPGDTVAMIGTGFLGIIVTALAAQTGARVIAISRRQYALDTARKAGAAETIVMDDHNQIIQKVMQLTEGNGCDKVIEATGYQWPLDLAGELTRTRGKMIIAGYHQDGPRQINMQIWNWKGLDVINAHERDQNKYISGIRKAIDKIANGSLDPFDLLTHEYRIEQMDQAFQDMTSRPDGFIKGWVNFQ